MSNNWIFLRGLTRGNVHWGEFPDLFLKANPVADVEYLEIPGNGLLNNEESPLDPNILIDLLRQKSRLAQSQNSYNLCGISLGGIVALKWTELYPQNVESVFIINSSLAQFSNFYSRLKPINYFKLLNILTNRDCFKQEKSILEITSNYFDRNEKYLQNYSQFAKKFKFHRKNFFRQLLLAQNIYIHNYPNVKLKVIATKADRLVDFSCSLDLAKNLNGNLVIHPTAGHDLPLDEPAWLIEQLLLKF